MGQQIECTIPKGTVLSCRSFYGDYQIHSREHNTTIGKGNFELNFSTITEYRNEILEDILNRV
jgi:hypothetical protein